MPLHWRLKSINLKLSIACFRAAATTYTVDPDSLCMIAIAKEKEAMKLVFPFFRPVMMKPSLYLLS